MVRAACARSSAIRMGCVKRSAGTEPGFAFRQDSSSKVKSTLVCGYGCAIRAGCAGSDVQPAVSSGT